MAKESTFYIDDLDLTKRILKEIKEKERGERKMCSEELAKDFIMVLEHYLTRHNVVNYTKNYKDEFRSKAYELFVKHWYKFDPKRARVNFYQRNDKLYLKDESEWKGAFGWFSLLCSTAIKDEINKFNKRNDKLQEIVENKNKELEYYDSYLFKG